MSTAAYIDLDTVYKELPAGYDNTVDLPDADVDIFALEESRDIDTHLGAWYCTFNPHNHATYPTPQKIKDIARDGTVAKCLDRIGMGDRTSALGKRAQFFADRKMAALLGLVGFAQAQVGGNAATVDAGRSLPAETVASETLVWGGGGPWELQPNQAFLDVESHLDSADIPQLMIESVLVTVTALTLYRIGRDYTVHLHPDYLRFVFTDLGGALVNEATPTVTYRWQWLRAAWRPTTVPEDDEVVFSI